MTINNFFSNLSDSDQFWPSYGFHPGDDDQSIEGQYDPSQEHDRPHTGADGSDFDQDDMWDILTNPPDYAELISVLQDPPAQPCTDDLNENSALDETSTHVPDQTWEPRIDSTTSNNAEFLSQEIDFETLHHSIDQAIRLKKADQLTACLKTLSQVTGAYFTHDRISFLMVSAHSDSGKLDILRKSLTLILSFLRSDYIDLELVITPGSDPNSIIEFVKFAAPMITTLEIRDFGNQASFYDPIINHLRKSSNRLHSLYICANSNVPLSIENLNLLKNLRHLKIKDTIVRHNGLALPKEDKIRLTSLSLENVRVNGYPYEALHATLHNLFNLSEIRTLELIGSKGLSFKENYWQKLEKLRLVNDQEINNIAFGVNFPSIKHIELRNCSKLNKIKRGRDFYFETIVIDNCPQLTSFNGKLNNTRSKHQYRSSVRFYKIADCPNLETAINVAGEDNLQHTEIVNCPKIKELVGITKLKGYHKFSGLGDPNKIDVEKGTPCLVLEDFWATRDASHLNITWEFPNNRSSQEGLPEVPPLSNPQGFAQYDRSSTDADMAFDDLAEDETGSKSDTYFIELLSPNAVSPSDLPSNESDEVGSTQLSEQSTSSTRSPAQDDVMPLIDLTTPPRSPRSPLSIVAIDLTEESNPPRPTGSKRVQKRSKLIPQSKKVSKVAPKYLPSVEVLRPIVVSNFKDRGVQRCSRMQFNRCATTSAGPVNHIEIKSDSLQFEATYHTTETNFTPSEYQRMTLVLCGRKDQALIPKETSRSGRIVLMMSESEYHSVGNLVSDSVDVMVIKKLKETSDPDILKKPTSRRLAALTFAWIYNLDNIMLLDDNIETFYGSPNLNEFGKGETTDWSTVYKAYQKEAKAHDFACLGTKSLGSENHTLPNDKRVHLVDSFGAKLFYIRTALIKETMQKLGVGDPQTLFPLDFSLWGEDIFFNYLLENLNLRTGAFHRRSAVILRSTIQGNIAARVVRPATDWHTHLENFSSSVPLPEYYLQTCRLMCELVERSIRKYQKEFQKAVSKNLPNITRRFLESNQSTESSSTASPPSPSSNDSKSAKATKEKIALPPNLTIDPVACQTLIEATKGALESDQNLRGHQKEALEKTIQFLETNSSGYYQMATGSGKTRIFLRLAIALAKQQDFNKNCLIIAPNIQICAQIAHNLQTLQRAEDITNENMILVNSKAVPHRHLTKNKEYIKKFGHIIIMCSASFKKFAAKGNDVTQFGTIIVDESHLLSPETAEFLDELTQKTRTPYLQFSATPFKEKSEKEGKEVQCIYRYSPKQALNDGVISHWYVKELKCSEETPDEEIIENIADLLQNETFPNDPIKTLRNTRGVIYVKNQKTAELLQDKLSSLEGITSAVHTHQTPNRESLRKSFQKGKLNILIVVRMLKEGYDGLIDFVIIANPKIRRYDYKQIRGRAIRKDRSNPDKTALIYVPSEIYSNIKEKDSRRYLNTHSSSSSSDSVATASPITPGVIPNAGNSCFIASALQVIAAIPNFHNGVNQRGMTRIFLTLISIIKQGQPLEAKYLKAFRKSCLNRKIVNSPNGQEDAQEFLNKLLNYLGKPLKLESNVSYTPHHYMGCEPLEKDPMSYSSMQEMLDGKDEPTNIEVSAPQSIVRDDGQEFLKVDMQTMVDDFWEKEDVEFYVRAPQGEGYRKEKWKGRVKRSAYLEKLPDVININVKQEEDFKIIPQNADYIYPAGRSAPNSPRYRLVAAIEHKPGHYVARVRSENGDIFEMNDAISSRVETFDDCGGCSYFYVKETEEQPQSLAGTSAAPQTSSRLPRLPERFYQGPQKRPSRPDDGSIEQRPTKVSRPAGRTLPPLPESFYKSVGKQFPHE